MKLKKSINLEDLETKNFDSFQSLDSIRSQAYDVGIHLPESIHFDGIIHRFSTNGKAGDDAGYYALHSTEFGIAGIIGDHRRSFGNGETHITVKGFSRPLSPLEHTRMQEAIKQAIEEKKKLKAEKQDKTAENVLSIWENAGFADPEHPYIKAKGLLSAHGSKITGDGRLIVPMYSSKGKIRSLQYISAEGNKRYHTGGEVRGKFWILGDITDAVFVAEGFATGATIREETDLPVAVAYSANNIPPVVENIRALFPDIKITIVADNDESGTGENYANQAASKHNCLVITPPTKGDVNDYRQSGGDVKSLLLGTEKLKDFFKVESAANISDSFIPPDELIEDFFVKGTTAVIYGDSNSGKTFFSLSLARDVSMGWHCYGKEVQKGKVLYIAVEAPNSIKTRIQAMNKFHKTKFTNIDIITRPVNFYAESGVELKLIDYIKSEKEYNFVIVDTLAQASAGANENSTEDMSPIMQKFELIAKETNTAVLIIHHSGKDKTRGARGSSSIFAHISTEILVTDEDGDKTATFTKQRELGSKGMEIPYKLEIVEMGKSIFGKPFSTCVAIEDGGERSKKRSKKDLQDIAHIEGAYICHGEIDSKQNLPFISTQKLEQFLVENSISKNEKSAKQAVKSSGGGLVSRLIKAEVITDCANGFLIIDNVISSALMLKN